MLGAVGTAREGLAVLTVGCRRMTTGVKSCANVLFSAGANKVVTYMDVNSTAPDFAILCRAACARSQAAGSSQ